MKKSNLILIQSDYTQGPGRTTAKSASVVIHSKLVAGRSDKDFSVTELFNQSSIKYIFPQT